MIENIKKIIHDNELTIYDFYKFNKGIVFYCSTVIIYYMNNSIYLSFNSTTFPDFSCKLYKSFTKYFYDDIYLLDNYYLDESSGNFELGLNASKAFYSDLRYNLIEQYHKEVQSAETLLNMIPEGTA